LILLQQQPFTTTSIWAQNRVFRQVRDSGFKVVLDGQGADELFAGYPVFRAARMTALIQRREWGALRQLVGGSPGAARELMRSCEPLLPERLRRSLRHLVRRPDLPAWLNAGWFGRHLTTYARPTADLTMTSPLTGELYDAMAVSSLPMLLRYADRNAMAVSLENRVPFLSVPLAEFALSLPDALRIGADGTTKLLVRRAMRGLVPDIVLDRRDKIGFATPEGRWFRDAEALRAALEAQARSPLPTCFAPIVTQWLRDVSAGTRPYSAEVWRTWNVLRWAELMQLEFPA